MTENQFIAFYPSRDLKATRVFYEDILGLELARDQGTCLIFRVHKGAFIGFCKHLRVMNDSSFIITLVADNVDAYYEKLVAENTPIEEPPHLNQQYQIYHFFTQDPNGYRVEIQRFSEALE